MVNKIKSNCMYKFRIRILLVILIFNLLPFIILYFHLEGIRQLIDDLIYNGPPAYGIDYTESPHYVNIWYHIFRIDIYVILLYFLFIFISYYVFILRNDDFKIRIGIIGLIEIVFISTFYIYQQNYLIPLLLMYNISLILLTILTNYAFKKSLKKSNIFLLLLFTFFGSVINVLYKYHSLHNQSIEKLLIQNIVENGYNLNYIQSISKYVLYDSLTQIYFSVLLITFFYLLYSYVLKKISSNNKHFKNAKRVYLTLLIIFISINILQIRFDSLYNIKKITFDNRTIEPISGCFNTKMNIGLGKDYLEVDDKYFESCFETTDGVFSVYKKVKSTDQHPFDLIQKTEFTRIYVLNSQGDEILSYNLDNNFVNIFVTTEKENKNGYNNLILVEEQNDNYHFGKYSFYDFSGKFILELPNGIAEPEYAKKDALNDGFRIFFKENHIIYNNINDGKQYKYFINGDKELIDD